MTDNKFPDIKQKLEAHEPLRDSAISWDTDKAHFIPMIEDWANALSAYDARRPKGHPYPFDKHAQRVAQDIKSFALFLGLSPQKAGILYWATLPHDIGKTALPIDIWDSADKPSAAEKKLRRQHVAKGLEILDTAIDIHTGLDATHPFVILMRQIMENHHEALDGSGLFKKAQGMLDDIDRLSCICDSFDGWSVKRPHFGDRDLSPNSVLTRMETEKAGQFDADLLTAFRAFKMQGQ